MKFTNLLAVAATMSLAQAASSDHWAVIVAGSNGYTNYRHQADACHAYQIMRNNGIPEEQIILMSYDDVATDPNNPFPGKLFNKPSDGEGEDVYAGCNIDYREKEVTKANFFAVLEGDAETASGKVLAGDKNSKVFVNFIDHGAVGVIGLPTDAIKANELNQAIENSWSNGLFGEMVFYLEACESGSMFDTELQVDINVYAVTASDAHVSSWGTYCYPSDMVNGRHMNTCLGDLFSVNWMEDTDQGNLAETLQEQYDVVKTLTDKSPVLQFGDLSFVDSLVTDFEGDLKSVSKMDKLFDQAKKLSMYQKSEQAFLAETVYFDTLKKTNIVSSRDATFHHLTAKVLENGSPEDHQALADEIQARMTVDKQVEKVFNYHFDKEIPHPTDYDCLTSVMAKWESECGAITDYSMQYVKYMVAECEAIKLFPAAIEETFHKITNACQNE